MKDVFYKTMVVQIKDNINIGNSLLTEEYQKASDAFAAGEAYKFNEMSKVEVRQYDRTNNINIISFDHQDSGRIVYADKEDLVQAVISEYKSNSVEISDEYLSGKPIFMSKADLLLAWSEIQKECNGDVVVRLDESGQECEELIPEGWGKELVDGDAKSSLLGISEEQKEGGPIFARWYDDNEGYLDLVFGELEASSQDIEY